MTRSGAGAPELQRWAPRSRHGEGQALALRDGEAFFQRSAGACPPRTSRRTVARGPVPRDRCMARDRPSPYGKTRRYRRTVARGPVPRDRWGARGMARDRPSPYGKKRHAYRAFNSPQRVVSLPRAPTCPFKRVVAKGKRIPPKDTSSSR